MNDYERELLRAMRVASGHVTWWSDPTVEGAQVLEAAVGELSDVGQEYAAWCLALMLTGGGGEPLVVDERLVEVDVLLARAAS
jgi:hypothetical protein